MTENLKHNDFVIGQTYQIKIKDWESPLGDLVEGDVKVRTVLDPLPADHELRDLMLRVFNRDRNREHLIAFETIESAQAIA